jgi:CspA family cold shock protein
MVKERGWIVTFNNAKGFGFIRRDSGEQDIFFHVNTILPGVIVQYGLRVSFDCGLGKNGRLHAINVGPE